MESTKIYQFTLAQSVEIVGTTHAKIGPLVSIIQDSGSLRFQFSMTTQQALAMADALIAHAAALEQAE